MEAEITDTVLEVQNGTIDANDLLRRIDKGLNLSKEDTENGEISS